MSNVRGVSTTQIVVKGGVNRGFVRILTAEFR